ncbi:DUF4148 domain-containing protein [Achromobacter mucicolens]|uniref:DUF4148 domain-containing protein n=2 Tax=Achromobacter TaxID=222 RepID=UPI0039756CCA
MQLARRRNGRWANDASSFSPSRITLLMRNHMNRLTLALISSALSIGIASTGLAQPKTGEQVQQELQQARTAGQVTYGELAYPPSLPSTPAKTRSDVAEELRAAQADGQVTYAELDYPPAPSAASSRRMTREEVRAELDDAKADGQTSFAELDYPPPNNG